MGQSALESVSDLDALFAPSEPPPVRLFSERIPSMHAMCFGFRCLVCRGGVRATVDDVTLESARSMIRVVSGVLFDLADMYRGHVCPGHDPGDEDRS